MTNPKCGPAASFLGDKKRQLLATTVALQCLDATKAYTLLACHLYTNNHSVLRRVPRISGSFFVSYGAVQQMQVHARVALAQHNYDSDKASAETMAWQTRKMEQLVYAEQLQANVLQEREKVW